MVQRMIIASVLVDESVTMSSVDICQTYHISEAALLTMVEHGLFSNDEFSLEQLSFDRKMLERLETARRLQDDLGVNVPGVVLALELLDELERIRGELAILRRHVEGP